jgi:excinuclease ABC subunit A
MSEVIRLRGVRVHNLKNVDLDIPVNALTVITGPSGSGKSSLAFDTLYAEGRRRYVQSLSAYARQFLERLDRPDADLIESIFPAIAIQQKNTVTGSRSTVGTVTEVHDYLRLLYARIGVVRCTKCGSTVRRDTVEDVAAAFEKLVAGAKVLICFNPPAAVRPGVLRKKGFVRFLDGESERRLDEVEAVVTPDKPVVVDRLVKGKASRSRVAEAAESAFREGNGGMSLLSGENLRRFDNAFRCAKCEIEFVEPDPLLFSFNNPYGACLRCRGFGDIIDLNLKAVIPRPDRSLRDGAVEPLRPSSRRWELREMLDFAESAGIPIDKPWKNLSPEQQELIISGADGYAGVRGFFNQLEKKKYRMHVRVLLSRYRGYSRCPECKGARLRRDALLVRIGRKNISEVAAMPISQLNEWLENLTLNEYQMNVVARVLAELRNRTALLNKIGVGYLSLSRRAQTLSGGETQRINLATALGGGLIGTLFVLDEPTIGLHPRDGSRLIEIVASIRDIGNTVVVVEHDRNVMEAADNIVDLGPGAGGKGGEVVYAGSPASFKRCKDSVTAKFLRGERSIPLPPLRRKPGDAALSIRGAREHNLKNINIEIPLNLLVCVTGVSGSGKSTLVHEVLYANAMAERRRWKKSVGECDGIDGLEQIGKIEMVDQSPIGSSPRSNPVTYMKAFAEIREIFAARYSAKMRGCRPSDFSFNVKGGRCETCKGNGQILIEMQFLPDVYVECEDCRGTRYRREILDIRFKGLNIHQVLQTPVEDALELFRDFPSLCRKLGVMEEVGLGYLQLGQPATTLSGGEAQRLKLANHMSRTNVSGTLYIFDEPTTGLHFADIQKLLQCFRRLVFHGASVLVIEHNLDVIKNADWIIDLGPEGGEKGGWVVATGTPEEVAGRPGSYTGNYLKKVLGNGDA